MMLLEVSNMVVHYEKVKALKGISITMKEGSIVCLIGANGAGKSTTLKGISGLKRLNEGEIIFKGERIDGLSPMSVVRKGIALCPEGRRIFPFLTVLENLHVGAYINKNGSEIKATLEKIYQRFPVLKERSKQAGSTLSGGEQQMLAIGRALMSRPELILFDEPSLGLAPLVVREIGRIIREIRDEGVSVILVEQNANMALKLSDWGYVLETGKIALQGESKILCGNEYVKKAYLGA